MNNKLILSLDQGSSSSRAAAFDAQGRCVCRAVRAVETRRQSAEGFCAGASAEMDAQALLDGQLEALKEVLSQTGTERVGALSVAGQRSTVVFWDRLSGKPLAPALGWQDGRAGAQVLRAGLSRESVHRLTGLYPTPFYSAAKIAWTLEHVPPVRQAAADGRLCIGPTASYVIWHLTRGRVFACDATLAQRTLLFNISTLNWEPQLLEAFGVRREWLPQIKRSTDDYGCLEVNGRSIPICVCAGDQQAALQALRVVSGGACINYGTGAFFMRHTGNRSYFLPGLLTSVSAQTQGAAEYLLEGPVNACGTLFAWLSEIGFSFGAEELDGLCEAARNPADILPALGGLGAPYWDFAASPVIAGLSPQTKKADIAAGAVNALACLLADMVFYAERFGIKSAEIKVSGGFSKSRALLRRQADILQTRLLPCSEAEGTCAGAAMMGAARLGWDVSQWQTLRLLPAVEPRMDAEEAEALYRRWHGFLNWCKLRK